MAHWNVCIITEDDKSPIDQLTEKALEVLDKFSYEIDSAPNKRYVDQYQIDGLKKHLKIDDLERLVKGAGDLYGEDCFTDENGIYYMSNTAENPEGHFNYAEILGRVLPKDFGLAFLGEDVNRLCRAIITMDGTWLEGPWQLGEPTNPEKITESDEWAKKLASILEENKHAAIFIADCNS